MESLIPRHTDKSGNFPQTGKISLCCIVPRNLISVIILMFITDICPSVGLRIILAVWTVLKICGNTPVASGKIIRCALRSAKFHPIPAHNSGCIVKIQCKAVKGFGDIFGGLNKSKILIQYSFILLRQIFPRDVESTFPECPAGGHVPDALRRLTFFLIF